MDQHATPVIQDSLQILLNLIDLPMEHHGPWAEVAPFGGVSCFSLNFKPEAHILLHALPGRVCEQFGFQFVFMSITTIMLLLLHRQFFYHFTVISITHNPLHLRGVTMYEAIRANFQTVIPMEFKQDGILFIQILGLRE